MIDMVKWWYGRMIWICQYGLVMKWCNFFVVVFQMVKWSNHEKIWEGGFIYGDMLKWCCVNMVKYWRKINSKMNCMVIFNCCLGYQLGFSLLIFHPVCQFLWSWRLLGWLPVLSLAFVGLYSIMACILSLFSGG